MSYETNWRSPQPKLGWCSYCLMWFGRSARDRNNSETSRHIETTDTGRKGQRQPCMKTNAIYSKQYQSTLNTGRGFVLSKQQTRLKKKGAVNLHWNNHC